jgi:hypothetical protein
LIKAGKAFRYVPFYTQVPQRAEFPSFKEGPPSFNQALSILKTVKEDEVPQVLNWINTMFTEEWEDVRFWGPKEAGLYEELADGKRKFKDENIQKFLVESDLNAMERKDVKGLYDGGTPCPGYWEGVVKLFATWGYCASRYNPVS